MHIQTNVWIQNNNFLKDQPYVALAYMTGIVLRSFGILSKSVVEAMLRHRFSNYWTSTETQDALKIYMDMDYDGLRADIVRMLGGESVKVNTLSFQNDMCNFRTKDDVLTLPYSGSGTDNTLRHWRAIRVKFCWLV